MKFRLRILSPDYRFSLLYTYFAMIDSLTSLVLAFTFVSCFFFQEFRGIHGGFPGVLSVSFLACIQVWGSHAIGFAWNSIRHF